MRPWQVKPFKLQIKAYDGQTSNNASSFYFVFEDGALTFRLSLDHDMRFDPSKFVTTNIIFFDGEEKPGPSYSAQNVYGAKQNVDVQQIWRDGIAPLAAPAGERGSYVFEIVAAGATAKALTEQMVAVVEGTIGKLGTGKVASATIR